MKLRLTFPIVVFLMLLTVALSTGSQLFFAALGSGGADGGMVRGRRALGFRDPAGQR